MPIAFDAYCKQKKAATFGSPLFCRRARDDQRVGLPLASVGGCCVSVSSIGAVIVEADAGSPVSFNPPSVGGASAVTSAALVTADGGSEAVSVAMVSVGIGSVMAAALHFVMEDRCGRIAAGDS
jgi:hypothetical protein